MGSIIHISLNNIRNFSDNTDFPELISNYDVISNNIVIDDDDTIINNNCIFNNSVEFNFPVKIQNGVQFSGELANIETTNIKMNPSRVLINNVENYVIPMGGIDYTKGIKSITGI